MTMLSLNHHNNKQWPNMDIFLIILLSRLGIVSKLLANYGPLEIESFTYLPFYRITFYKLDPIGSNPRGASIASLW
jgi:hypothetical protein